jgi:hypothetical protein
MSAPVDVLAVMDESIRRAEERGNIEGSDRLQASRAAVAELIGALGHARSTLATALRHAAPDLFETDDDVNEHLAIKRIDAALTSASGGAA